jgi:hypothetical protein
VGLTSNIGSTMVNDLRLNYSTLGNRISPRGSGPEVRIRNTNFKIGTNRIFPQSRFQNRWQLREDFSWQKGNHNIKAARGLLNWLASRQQASQQVRCFSSRLTSV